jgi:hypothetical protein
MYSKYQFKGTSEWHPYGMLMRIFAIVAPFIMQYKSSSWKDYFLAGAINIILWEVLINKIALKKEWLYVGTTSKLDIHLKKYKWLLYFGLLILAIIIKS